MTASRKATPTYKNNLFKPLGMTGTEQYRYRSLQFPVYFQSKILIKNNEDLYDVAKEQLGLCITLSSTTKNKHEEKDLQNRLFFVHKLFTQLRSLNNSEKYLRDVTLLIDASGLEIPSESKTEKSLSSSSDDSKEIQQINMKRQRAVELDIRRKQREYGLAIGIGKLSKNSQKNPYLSSDEKKQDTSTLKPLF